MTIIQFMFLVGSLLEEYQREIILCLCAAACTGGVLYLFNSPNKVRNIPLEYIRLIYEHNEVSNSKSILLS